jgi:diguanylate cyclase (GGDEF)-like protein
LGSALPAAALLWLGGAIAARARVEQGETRWALLLVAMGMAIVGLWWPLHGGLSAAAGADPLASILRHFVAAVGMAALLVMCAVASAGDDAWLSGRRIAAAATALLLGTLCIAAGSPGGAVDSAAGWVARCVVGSAVLVGALITLLGASDDTRRCRGWRIAGAGVAAVGMTVAPGLPQTIATPWASTGAAPVAAMLLVGAPLLLLLRRLPLRGMRSSGRTASPTDPTEDALTGLITRSAFETRLAGCAIGCDSSGARLALMFIDLDGFKPVNDSFGHASGDQVLRAVGKRLRDVNRGSGDLVARVGGDEFLVLLTGEASTQDGAALRARQIVQTLSRPYELDGRQVAISCSIGIAFYPDGATPAKLIARADAAMYAAKRAGGAGFCFFAPQMEEDARERFDLLRELRRALERNELELYYQPKIDATTGKVTAAEALLRWQHPTRGMVPPATFMPIAERFGLIRDIGHWVIEDACRQARVWYDRGLRMRVAINLSAVQMRQEDIVARIEGALARHHVDPSLLTCEITESVAMEDTRATQATFHELGAAGIHLSIDDFGTGYSSLAYLRKLPAEELKIDRSFVTDVEHSADARSVVDAVVKLAHALGLKVVAEGIENERQRVILTELGCDELQGFLFAKPMTARALLLWAMEDKQDHAEHFASSLFVSTVRAQLDEPVLH